MTDAYKEAVARWPLTPEAVECGAKALALAIAGGEWNRDYTDKQKERWRACVRCGVKAMEG